MRAAAALAVGCLLAAGCGGGEAEESGDLRWVSAPSVYASESLPDEHVASGRVRNEGLEPFKAESKELRLFDEDGRRVEGTMIFSRGYSHPLRSQRRGDLPESVDGEDFLRGTQVALAPGKELPLTVAWRVRKGGKPPVRVDYGSGSLPLR
ncbi:MAG: hypothetical protein H0V29_08030 [Thermoleophilaceae bacterium]|nr:hypothetical protein [Thermoleophilaceae bacterium]